METSIVRITAPRIPVISKETAKLQIQRALEMQKKGIIKF